MPKDDATRLSHLTAEHNKYNIKLFGYVKRFRKTNIHAIKPKCSMKTSLMYETMRLDETRERFAH